MQSITYNQFKNPCSKYCVVIGHQCLEPYVRQFDYFSKFVKPNMERYCKDHDIDFILIDDFKRDQYQSSEDDRFLVGNNVKRCTNYPFIAIREILTKYDYILLQNSNNLIHKTYPHFKDLIPNLEEFDAVFLNQTNNSQNNIPWVNGWMGHNSICNVNVAHHWFDEKQLLKFGMNDIYYRRHYLAQNNDLYRYKFLNDVYMLVFDNYVHIAMGQMGQKGVATTPLNVCKYISKTVNFQQQLNDPKYVCSFFGGCGSYSPMWQLRYLLLEYVATTYSEYHY